MKRKNTEEFKREVFDLVGNKYEILGEYVNNKEKILIRHNSCGHEFKMKPNDFQQGHRCPYCTTKSKKQCKPKNTKWYISKIYEQEDGNEYKLLENYVNTKTPIIHKHNCGYEWKIRPRDFLQGKRCPRCARIKHVSKNVQKIRNYLDDENIIYNMEVSFKNLKYKQLLRFDFQIFLEDGSFILLEYNGEQHYRKAGYLLQEDFENQQKRDQIKINYCKANSIPLYIIKYDEDIEKRLEEILY